MSDSVGSVSVEVVPDARGWSEKLRAQIRDQSVKVTADADTADAEEKLDRTARTRTAKIKADTSQLSNGAKNLDSFVGKLGLLPALAITAGAALVPLGAALGGVVAALAAPLAIAGGGATLFALLGGAAVKQTQTQLKNIDTLSKKLSGLTKGTKEYADTQKQLRDAQAALSPAQERFATSLSGLKGAFSDLLSGSTGKSLLGPFTQGMDLLSKILPLVAPLIASVSGAFSTLLGDLGNAAGGRGFKLFVDQFARLAGRDIVIGGHILGDLAKGVGSLLFATDKGFSGGFLRGLERLTSSFADWANSREGRRDVNHFFDYVHQVGPQVADTLGAIARGAGHFVKALAPLGPPVLHIIEGIADAFNAMPLPVLTALAGAAAGLVAFQKVGGFKATSLLTKGLGGGGGIGGLLTGGVQKVFVVNMGAGGLGGGASSAEKGGLFGLLTRGIPALGGLSAGAAGAYGLAGAGVGLLANKGYQLSHTNALLDGPLGFNTLVDHIGSGALHIGSGGPRPTPAAPMPAPLTSTTNAFDALRARAAQASRQIDLIGPHADATFASASHDVDAFNAKLNSIHDRKFAIIAQTQSAVTSLERLQAFRIRDKSFTVYQRNQQIERAPGPGGGQGQNPHGSGPGGGSGGGSGRTPVHIHLDETGRETLSGFMQGNAQHVYDTNRRFEGEHG